MGRLIEPTVGRVVWYRAAKGGNKLPLAVDNEPLAAMVTGVLSDRLVNLMVMDRNGSPVPKQHVLLIQDGDTVPCGDEDCYCEWMPYQKGQAAKEHELLERLHLRLQALERSFGRMVNDQQTQAPPRPAAVSPGDQGFVPPPAPPNEAVSPMEPAAAATP